MVEILLAESAPLISMRTKEVAAFVRSALKLREGVIASVVSALIKYNVDGAQLMDIAQSKKFRTERLNSLGVSRSARGPLLRAVKERIKQDKAKNCEVYKRVSKKAVYKGLTTIMLSHEGSEPVKVRDSAAAIAKFFGVRQKKKFDHEPVFYFDKSKGAAAAAFDRDVKLESLDVAQLGAWLSSNPDMRRLSKNDVATLIANLKKRKVSGRTLAEICLANNGLNHMLSARGIRTNVRSVLVEAVKNAMTDKRTGYTVMSKRARAETSAKATKDGSKMMEAFRKHKSQGKKASMNWPDIEVLHRSPAAKGGTQIAKFVIKSMESFEKKNASTSVQQNSTEQSSLVQ